MKTRLNGKAQHPHTCRKCEFLGHTVVGGRHFDIYECKSQTPTFVARFGSREESYYSFPDPAVIAMITVNE